MENTEQAANIHNYQYSGENSGKASNFFTGLQDFSLQVRNTLLLAVL